MALETVGKLVAAHSVTSAPQDAAKLTKAEAERALVRQMFTWMSWGALVMGIAVLMLVVNKSFDFGKWFGLVAAILLLGGTGIATFGLFRAMREGTNLTGTTAPKSLAQTEPTKHLPGERTQVPLPSVTERTTQIMSPKDTSKDQE